MEFFQVETHTQYSSDLGYNPLDVSRFKLYYAKYASGIPYIWTDWINREVSLPYTITDKTNGICMVVPCRKDCEYVFKLDSSDTYLGTAVAEYPSIDLAINRTNNLGNIPIGTWGYKSRTYTATSDGIILFMIAFHEAAGAHISSIDEDDAMSVDYRKIVPSEDASHMFTITFKISGAQGVFEFPFENESLTDPTIEFYKLSV